MGEVEHVVSLLCFRSTLSSKFWVKIFYYLGLYSDEIQMWIQRKLQILQNIQFTVHIHFLGKKILKDRFSSVQFGRWVVSDSLWPPWVAAHQASLFIINSWSLLKLMSIKSVRPSRNLILCHPLLLLPQFLPASGSFPMSQLFTGGSQSTVVSASASVLPINTQDWSPLGWTGWISLQSKGLSRVFSNTTVQKHQFFSAQLSSQSNSHIHTWPLVKP